jgi:hypothetical protein
MTKSDSGQQLNNQPTNDGAMAAAAAAAARKVMGLYGDAGSSSPLI